MDRLPEELNVTGQSIPFKEAEPAKVAQTQAGYGTDPNVITPAPNNWPGLLSRREQKLIAALSDIILPATAEYPAPSQIGIAKFFDQWLSAPYHTQQGDKTKVLTLLDLIEQESRRLYWTSFLWLSQRRKKKVIDAVISNAGDPRSFFIRFRYLVVGAYFTSDVGFKAIGYLGNVPLQAYAPVSKELGQIIDEELRQIGL